MIDIFDDTPPSSPYRHGKTRSKKQRAAAVAIKHELESGKLPQITASGYGKLAERIVEIAFEHGVRVREDADLAQLLSALDLEAEIPPEALYAVAEVLSYVYRANNHPRMDDSPTIKDNSDTTITKEDP